MLSHVPPSTSEPIWKQVDNFYAESALQDKVQRLVNSLIFAYAFSAPVLDRVAKLPKVFITLRHIALLLATRKTLAVVAGYITYEATCIPKYQIAEFASKAQKKLHEKKLFTKSVTLHLSGTSYEAMIVIAPKFFNSKICTIHACGINKPFQQEMYKLAMRDITFESYSLFINGPSVGNSSGLPTSNQIIGASQSGIQHAEKILQAKSIIVCGHSFGGGFGPIGLSRHLTQQTKREDISYLPISLCTFSDLKSIAALTRTKLLDPVFTTLGLQLDNIEAARIFSEAQVQHIVVQGEQGSDPIIPDAVSLATVLKKQEITTYKTFIVSKKIGHGRDLPKKTQEKLDKAIKAFIDNAK